MDFEVKGCAKTKDSRDDILGTQSRMPFIGPQEKMKTF
jgi:hypothetical protein